ncbi:MAG: hypothetical protein Q8916_01640 [Bacteroidota bacterium]|nr:hypothetical protein [Bacteroidota bacterium]MDP4229089.1 hypothetical protein [Bacteroidota bacterium]MDP4235037.1 hypothetical protein [Bacteroidota bacterium]
MKLALIAAIGMIFSFGAQRADAQFSKAVVLLKGTVRMDQSGKAYSAKVSLRLAEDKDAEISAARSNSETGNYLLVLQPNKKYVIHIEGQDIAAQDELIETPATDSTIKMSKDFTVAPTSIGSSQDKASLK